MKNNILRTAAIIFILSMSMNFFSTLTVSAAESDDLVKKIETTIDSDKKELNSLPALLEKAYNKLISAFKKLGTLSKDISRVVKLYRALDEDSSDYNEKLDEFLSEYNKLSSIKRKVVDFCTGFLDMKDKLIASIKNIITVDLYSIRELDITLKGDVEIYSENETIAEVCDGYVIPNGIGTTKIVAQNSSGEKQNLRIIVKKPVLSRSLRVNKGKSITINIPSDVTINEIVVSNERIVYKQNGNDIEVSGISKGTSYMYVGTTDGKAYKYKVKVS